MVIFEDCSKLKTLFMGFLFLIDVVLCGLFIIQFSGEYRENKARLEEIELQYETVDWSVEYPGCEDELNER